jgi:hypothetical protein
MAAVRFPYRRHLLPMMENSSMAENGAPRREGNCFFHKPFSPKIIS